MNQLQQAVITMLKCAITQEKGVLPPSLDWAQLGLLAQKHHMAPLIYEGACLCGAEQDQPVMQRLFQSYCKALMVSERQMAAFRSICAAFEKNGIDYLPFKGCVMKDLYPRPELRMMGDADILIRQSQYGDIVRVMGELGFQAQKESDQDYVWASSSLYVELHKHLMPESDKELYRYFDDSWRFASVQVAPNRYDMSAEDMFVFLFSHFAKHYRYSGIGCRHVLDLWVYLRAHPELDREKVERTLEKLHLAAFYANIMRVLNVWFANEAPDEMTDFLTDAIFDNGSWGNCDTATVASAVNVSQTSSNGRAHYILSRLFPSREALNCEYPILRRAPVLMPAVCVYRLAHKLVTKRGLFRRHAHNLSLLTQTRMDNRKQMLRYVGLAHDDEE